MPVHALLPPSARYQKGVARQRWQTDPAQQAVLTELDRLYEAFHSPRDIANGLFDRLKSLFGSQVPTPVTGLYLWGNVGCGKTFLMDMFVASVSNEVVLRQHFHRFMHQVHQRLRALNQHQDPLAEVATGLAQHRRVLCLDEFLVNDIGDAMILGRLLQALFERGMSLVTTANTPPDQLYRDGLQRVRFLPAIALLQRYCRVIGIVSDTDWRQRALIQVPLYHTPDGIEAERALNHIFTSQAHGEVRPDITMKVNHRPIRLRKRADNVLWFDFGVLCDGPRAVADYLALARTGAMIIISHVPQFTRRNEEAARRFIALVDAFYDQRVKLALSAAVTITDLYHGQPSRREFERTRSRLIEMQSQYYLGQMHR